MFKLNLKIAFRNLYKNKGYTFINIAGLSIGMASCLLIFIFINYQLSFDRFFSNKDRIYRVITLMDYSGITAYSAGIPLALVPALRNELPQLEKVAAIQRSGGIIKISDDNGKEILKTAEEVYYAEPEFFEIFDTRWIAGKPATALSAPNTVVLSKGTAIQYFGSWKKAVGKSIRFQNRLDLKVTGIIADAADNSSFPLKIVLSYLTYSGGSTKWSSLRTNSNGFLLLKKGVDAKEFDTVLAEFSKKHYAGVDMTGTRKHLLQPLQRIHFDERTQNFRDKVVSIESIFGLGIIGLFILLTACINFINMATAQAAGRYKEVGVRKVMGSSRDQLIWQFLSETILITAISMLVACVLTELFLPLISGLMGAEISLSFFGQPNVLLFVAILLILVGFLAGFYPAMVMSGFSPALAIKNKGLSGAGSSGLALRKILVVAQFGITTLLIIGTLVVLRQMRYIQEKPLGFRTEAIAMVDVPSDSLSRSKYQLLQRRLSAIPGVQLTSFCMAAPSSVINHDTDVSYDHGPKADFTVNTKFADENYFKMFDLEMVAGRTLSKSDTLKEYVVNETLLKKLNISNPVSAIGKKLTVDGNTAPIVGVVKDFINASFHESISPIVIFSQKPQYTAIAIRLETKSMLQAMKSVEKEWNEILPDHVYGAAFLNDEINHYYQTEQSMGILFKICSGLILFISFIGLFGLVSFIVSQRTKEIAIRKVLGADTIILIRLLNSSFLKMVFLANLLSWPLAYVFISKWLSGFVYRIELSIWPFAFAMLISMLITFLTVSLRSYGATRRNPIAALKYE